METMEQMAVSSPTPGQAAVKTGLLSSTRGTLSYVTTRFHGDGVRYKAKVIGVDPVTHSHGEKMCWDSMMKLKGFEEAARRQGRHKLRIWLMVSTNGLKIVDERTGAVMYDHHKSRISSLTKDSSDPRALAYVYKYLDTYTLFYIKTANMADPVIMDIAEVLGAVDHEPPQEPAAAPAQPASLLVVNDQSSTPAQEPALQELSSPQPDPPSAHPTQASSTNELMQVFSVQMEEPMMPDLCSPPSQPEPVQQETRPPQPVLSTSQILSMFPTQPRGGSPYASPPYSPSTMPWGQQGPLGSPLAGPAVAPWPTLPAGMAAAWGPAGVTAPPAGVQVQAPGVMTGGNTPTSPTPQNGFTAPSSPLYAPTGAAGTGTSTSSSLDNLLL